jgi:hypothetical protein
VTKAWLATGAALLAVAAAGCGDGASRGEPAASTAPAATPEPAQSPASGAAPWPAPPNPVELTQAAGLEPQRREFLEFHVHSHLDLFLNGEPVPVPAGIGINVDDPGVQHGEVDGGPAYGGIEGCDQPCISPLHTHDGTGVLHTESLETQPNTLGQFFTEWGVRLDETCVGGYCRPDTGVAVYVNGEEYAGNPAEIQLTDGKEIAIVIGTPPAVIPEGYFSA